MNRFWMKARLGTTVLCLMTIIACNGAADSWHQGGKDHSLNALNIRANTDVAWEASWRTSASDIVGGPVIHADGSIYATQYPNRIIALSSEGNVLDSSTLSGVRFTSQPAMSDSDSLYVTASSGPDNTRLVKLSRSGVVEWNVPVPSPTISSPTLWNSPGGEHIYVVAPEGFYVYDREGGLMFESPTHYSSCDLIGSGIGDFWDEIEGLFQGFDQSQQVSIGWPYWAQAPAVLTSEAATETRPIVAVSEPCAIYFYEFDGERYQAISSMNQDSSALLSSYGGILYTVRGSVLEALLVTRVSDEGRGQLAFKTLWQHRTVGKARRPVVWLTNVYVVSPRRIELLRGGALDETYYIGSGDEFVTSPVASKEYVYVGGLNGVWSFTIDLESFVRDGDVSPVGSLAVTSNGLIVPAQGELISYEWD
jgi:hypothetical protein